MSPELAGKNNWELFSRRKSSTEGVKKEKTETRRKIFKEGSGAGCRGNSRRIGRLKRGIGSSKLLDIDGESGRKFGNAGGGQITLSQVQKERTVIVRSINDWVNQMTGET